jgi:hypothetical protein
MWEVLEFVLNVVLELAFDGLDLWQSWRFFLPVLGSVGAVALIGWLISNEAARLVLATPAIAGGVVGGIIWQVRGGQGP